ncbi:MAG: hypothetical protein ABIO44_08820 [Saprospiraceae bacterium]
MKNNLYCLLAGHWISCTSHDTQDVKLEDNIPEAFSTLDYTQCTYRSL